MRPKNMSQQNVSYVAGAAGCRVRTDSDYGLCACQLRSVAMTYVAVTLQFTHADVGYPCNGLYVQNTCMSV